MKNCRSLLLRLLVNEEGQVLPWMVLLVILFLGMAGLTVDLGRAWVCYRELQASTDAAALAGASAMTLSSATPASVYSAACSYSANTNIAQTSNCSVVGNNGTPNLPNVSLLPKLKCILPGPSYIGVPCGATVLGNNVIQVTQTAIIPTFFIQALGALGLTTGNSLTLNATSSATVSGSTPPVAVAILVDTTKSMSDPITATCGKTPIACALQGVQTLLAETPTCAQTDPSSGACTKNNYVGLFTFPAVNATTTSVDSCTNTGKGAPTSVAVMPYTYPTQPSSSDPASTWSSWTAPTSGATYEIAGFNDTFNTGIVSGTTGYGLSNSSPVAAATGAGSCAGMQAKGGEGTYYAGAINQAQAALMAQVNGDTSIQKVMIILSDGAANSQDIANPARSGYGSKVNECQQAIAAAVNATGMGTKVYSIAYNSGSTGCTTDSGGGTGGSQIAPCQTMQGMASTPADFYSEAGSASLCGTTGATLPAIFSSIVSSYSQGRLIPNS